MPQSDLVVLGCEEVVYDIFPAYVVTNIRNFAYSQSSKKDNELRHKSVRISKSFSFNSCITIIFVDAFRVNYGNFFAHGADNAFSSNFGESSVLRL